MSERKRTSRRCFLRMFAAGAALPAGSAMFYSLPLRAQDLPRLSEDDPAARALGYVHDADDVDRARFPNYEPGQVCSNCNLIDGEANAAWRPCQIFPGRAVASEGWCGAWVPQQP